MKQLGLIIGRFQPFHLGHKLLVNTSLQENTASLILIGSSSTENNQNPYPYKLRKQIIEQEYGENISLGALPDFPSDEQWINFILLYIPENVSNVILYCGDSEYDSAVQVLLKFEDFLPFKIHIKEIPRSIIPISATQIRSWIQEKDIEKLKKYLSEKTLLFLGLEL